MNYKSLSRVGIALTLVAAVAASLWFASPVPVRAVEISLPGLPTVMNPGQLYSFYAQVDINTNESIPITRLKLDISGPTPAWIEFNTDGTITNQSGHFASITPVVIPYYGYGYRYGYGYGYQPPMGYGFFSHTWGYGYGYGYGISQTTQARYLITLNTTSMALGSYTAQLSVLTGPGPKMFLSDTYAFTLSAPPPSAPLAPLPEPDVTDVSDVITDEGIFTQEVTVESEDGNIELTIGEGTTGLTEDGEPLSEITIVEMEEPPAPPSNSSVIGLTYDLGPDGATFDPPINLCFTYNPDDLPIGVNEEDLVIAIWVDGAWLELPSTVDTIAHTICAQVSHFTTFTTLASTAPAAFTTGTLTLSPTEVDIGESVTISVLVTNTGDLTDSYEVTLKIDNVAVATKYVTLAGGASLTVTFTTAKDVAGTYTVNINGLAGTFTVKAPATPAPAAFTASALTISPTEVDIGESVTISVLVTNTGDLTGSYEVTLKIDNVAVAAKDVSLAGGASQTVTFTTAKDVAGTYTININGLPGTFTVKTSAAPAAPAPAKAINWWLIGGIIAGVIVIGVIIRLVFRRRTA